MQDGKHYFTLATLMSALQLQKMQQIASWEMRKVLAQDTATSLAPLCGTATATSGTMRELTAEVRIMRR